MKDDKEFSDTTSITDRDVSYMLEKILDQQRTLLETHLCDSSLFISSDSEEDDGIADLSVTTHYCDGGSAGHCSQSNTSSYGQRTSCASTPPLTTETS